MGLDTSHDAWHGAYSAFRRWRDAISEAAGYEMARYAVGAAGRPIDLDKDHTFPAYLMERSIGINWMRLEDKNYMGEWDYIPCDITGPDPLLILLCHSDCDGYLEPEHCTLIADRLTELLPNLPEPEEGGHIGDYRVKTQHFIDGCRAAAAAGERLDFH